MYRLDANWNALYAVGALIPGFQRRRVYTLTGEWDGENKVILFDLEKAELQPQE